MHVLDLTYVGGEKMAIIGVLGEIVQDDISMC